MPGNKTGKHGGGGTRQAPAVPGRERRVLGGCGSDQYDEDGTAACLDQQTCMMKGPIHRHPLGPLYIKP